MNVYVGLTDWDWYDYLRDHNMAEVNFWKPSGGAFKTLQEGDLFLFKLKASAPRGKRLIVGGGFFVSASTTTIDWAWRAFGNENGVNNLAEFSDKIWNYKKAEHNLGTYGEVTNIILTDVFFFDDSDWYELGEPWSNSIVSGKTYRGEDAMRLVAKAESQLRSMSLSNQGTSSVVVPTAKEGFVMTQAKHRLGQGAFRTLVADAYQRRCAITGERTVPVLQAAHIKAFSAEGPNAVNNGILLRSDLHALFDSGYLTLEDDLRIVVSSRLHDDYGNGKDYYPYHGRRLMVVPEEPRLQPASEYLEWHRESVFLG